MPLAVLLSLALQAAAPAVAGAPAPMPSVAPVPQAPLPQTPVGGDGEAPSAAGLEQLRHAYRDSCEVRLYGEYDDMCSELSDQIRRYRAALARAARARPPG